MIPRKVFTLLISLLFLSACAATDKKWSESKSDNTNSLQSANQTVNYSVQWVDEATRGVLDQMEIMIVDNNSTPARKTIKAATVDLDILIKLSSVTPNKTQMTIDIQYPEGQKIKTTANEIFYKTRQVLLSSKTPEKTEDEEPVEFIIESFPLNTSGPSLFSNPVLLKYQ